MGVHKQLLIRFGILGLGDIYIMADKLYLKQVPSVCFNDAALLWSSKNVLWCKKPPSAWRWVDNDWMLFGSIVTAAWVYQKRLDRINNNYTPTGNTPRKQNDPGGGSDQHLIASSRNQPTYGSRNEINWGQAFVPAESALSAGLRTTSDRAHPGTHTRHTSY